MNYIVLRDRNICYPPFLLSPPLHRLDGFMLLVYAMLSIVTLCVTIVVVCKYYLSLSLSLSLSEFLFSAVLFQWWSDP